MRTRNDKGYIFVAPPYQGKSTVANALIQKGGAPLSDNVTMIECNTGRILPYLTPTGIREETLKKIPGLKEAVSRMQMPFITVSEVTGPVYLMHFDEIQACAPSKPTAPTNIVLLSDVGASMHGDYRFDILDTHIARTKLKPLIVDTCIPESEITRNLDTLLERVEVSQLSYDLANCNLTEMLDECFR